MILKNYRQYIFLVFSILILTLWGIFGVQSLYAADVISVVDGNGVDTLDSALDALGKPVVAYYRTGGDLYLARCADVNCVGITSNILVDNLGGIGEISLALNSGDNAVISYYDNTAQSLKVSYCTNASCSTKILSTPDPDIGNDLGRFNSLTLDAAGFPIIAYVDYTLNDVKVAHCLDTSCTVVNINTIDAGVVGYDTNIELDGSDNPMISYHDFSVPSGIKFVHCTDNNCATPITPITLFSGVGLSGNGNSDMTLNSSGFPVVVFTNGASGTTRVLRCLNTDCSSTITTLVSGVSVGSFDTSIALDSSDFPVITYYKDGSPGGDLGIIRCNDVNCSGADESFFAPDTVGNVGNFSSLHLDGSGFPVVAYHSATALDVKLLHCDDLFCSNFNASLSVTQHGDEVLGGSPTNITYSITVTPSNNTGSAMNFNFNIIGGGTATGGSDYTDPGTVTVSVLNGMPSGSTTVGVLEDALNEGAETVVGQISNPPANTTITTSTATANITDDDPPGAVVTPLSPCLGGICVTEGIITGVDYTVQLLSDPTNTVTVNISSSADYTRSQTSLTFNPSSAGSNLWNVPQIVTITAFDDGLVETNPEAVTLTHSFVGSLDLAYAGAPVPAPVTINVFDNDSPGVLITETSGSTSVSESGTTDTYSIELSTMPGNGGTNVSVYVQEVSGQCTISLSAPYLISFDNLTWNDPQIITVTAIDDSVIEGAHNCIISHTIDTVGTDDTDYDALTSLATITATITDNDPTAVAVHRSSSSGTNVLRRVLAEQKNTPALCVEFVTFMQLGDRGESVRDIQHFLNKHMGTSILEDGVFGLQTQENVRQFQRQYKVSVDGIVGYQTLLQLNAQYCQRSYCNAVILPTPNLRGTYS